MREFEEKGVQVLGLSTDNAFSLKAWADSMGGIDYPLLSDFHPHGETAQAYGLFMEERGMAQRAAVLIDKQGVVRYAKTYAPGTLPTPEELMAEVNKL